jgi:hypothetical protein
VRDGKGFEERRCLLRRGEGGVVCIILKCSEQKKRRKKFLSIKCLTVNENVACKRIINCTNAVELRDIKTRV